MRTAQTCPQLEQETVELMAVEGLTMVRVERHFGQGQRTMCAQSDLTVIRQPRWSAFAHADSLMRLLPDDRNVRKADAFYHQLGFIPSAAHESSEYGRGVQLPSLASRARL